MKKISVFLVMVIAPAMVWAQQRLKLEEAINIALQRNLNIQISKNNLHAADIGNHIGMAGGLPTVSAELNATEQYTSINQTRITGETTKVNFARGNNINTQLIASQVLYNGMRVHATKNRLEELEKMSGQELNSMIQNTIAEVMVQYYDIVRQQSYTATIDSAIRAARQRLDIIKARQSVGLANNVDLFQTEIDVNTLMQQYQQQELMVQQSKADFLRLLALRPDSSVLVVDTIVVDRNVQLQQVEADMLRNPNILAAEHQVRVMEFIERETAAQRYPSLRGQVGLNYNRSQAPAGFATLNQSYGPTIGLGLSIPIFNGGIFKRQQRIAEIDTRNARLQRENIVQDMQNNLAKAYFAYQNNLKQLETEQRNYQLAASLLNLIQQRFELGYATIIEVKDAQASFVNAGYRVVNLSFAAKVAEVELKRVGNQVKF